jgi:hypothetical protein
VGRRATGAGGESEQRRDVLTRHIAAANLASVDLTNVRGWHEIATIAHANLEGVHGAPHSPETMHAEFGAGFRLLDSVRLEHHTPSGATQAFVFCLCRVAA